MIINFRAEYNKTMNYTLPDPSEEVHHVLVKRATFPGFKWSKYAVLLFYSISETGGEHFDNNRVDKKQFHHISKRYHIATTRSSDKFVETALFMDPESYTMYRNFFTQAGVNNVEK